MRALLDVNVLIALLDQAHIFHRRAASWLLGHRGGWASSPTTQNGCVRIMCHPSYPGSLPVHAVRERLAQACAAAIHEFWPDEISFLDDRFFEPDRLLSHRQITDLYLLALAVRHDACFVTFDRHIPLNAVKHASARHLMVL